MNIADILSLPTTLKMAKKVEKNDNNIYALASGKGGVGKTFVSVSLACAWAMQGQRVLLFDGDFGLANIDIQLGQISPHDIASVLLGKVPLSKAVIHLENYGFDLIAGRSGSGKLADIDATRLQVILDDLHILAKRYDKVIIDLGAGIENAVRLFAAGAGNLWVMCNDEPTSITDGYAFIKMMLLQKTRAKIGVIINSANSHREGEKTYQIIEKTCETFLNASPELIGVVRRDAHVRDAIRAQTSIFKLSPNAISAEDIQKIAANN